MAQYSILIADEDPNTLQLLTGLLKNNGFQVTATSSGTEALKIYEQETPDIVLADLVMPELIRIVVNTAMQAEREEHLGVGPYERSIKRRGHSHGFKPKTVTTRMAPITGAGSALLIAWNGFVKKSVGAPEWPGYFQVRLHACVW